MERELRRKEKALAETAAPLVLEKTSGEGWDERHLDDEDDAVDEKHEK